MALLALYALALQMVLGGMAAAAAAGPDHVLCLAGTAGGPSPADPHLPATGHAACCVACHATGPVALPAPAAVAGAPIAHPVPPAGRRPRHIALPRAPPRSGHRARAPPVV